MEPLGTTEQLSGCAAEEAKNNSIFDNAKTNKHGKQIHFEITLTYFRIIFELLEISNKSDKSDFI